MLYDPSPIAWTHQMTGKGQFACSFEMGKSVNKIIRVETDYYCTRGDNRTGLEQIPKQWEQKRGNGGFRKDKHLQYITSGI